MIFPREIGMLFTASNDLVDAFGVKETSIWTILTLLDPILKSPLSHMWPSLLVYSEACDAMMDEVRTLGQILKNELIQNVNTAYINELCIIHSHSLENGSGCLIIDRRIDWWKRAFKHRLEVSLNKEKRKIFKSTNEHMIQKILLERMNCHATHDLNLSIPPAVVGGMGMPIRRISDWYESRTFVHAFDIDSLERETEQFHRLVSLKQTVGGHAADHIKYAFGNQGYLDSYLDFDILRMAS